MKPFPTVILLCPLFASCAAGPEEAPPPVTAFEHDGVLSVRVDGAPFADYHFAAEPRPYIYPLVGPAGIPLTRGFPMDSRPNEQEDHPHHQSLWYTHGAVNGIDFWHSPDARLVSASAPRVEVADGAVAAHLTYRWTAGDAVVLTEERTVRFGLDGQARTVDFTVKLRASAGDVVFGDTKEGSFALRLRPELRLEGPVARGSAQNSAGVRGPEVWGKRADWVVYYGPVEGQEVGVAIFDHPANPRHPTWWHARAYGLVAANPFGVHDFEGKPAGTGDLRVGAGDSVTFRYRVYLFSGLLAGEEVAAAYGRFARG